VSPITIQNPVINSPFVEPAKRFANGRSGSASRRAAVPRDQVRPTELTA
jgi:hypothetical protein